MNNLRKEEIFKLIILAEDNDTFKNHNDIRSVTINSLRKQLENLNYGIVLSENLHDLNYLKLNFSDNFKKEFIPEIIYEFEGFLKDAFFIKFFMIVENHINQIAEFYEKSENDIKDSTSVLKTFKKLTNSKYCEHFHDLTIFERELFYFYCFLRNTNHNIGLQKKVDQILIIKDSDSIINNNEIQIELIKGEFNNLSSNSLLLLKEQIFKLILKINAKIPKDDSIEHILVQNGYNDL